MQRITLATGNINKLKEVNIIAKDYDIEFVAPDGEFDPEENGNNFIENAAIKAICASKTSPKTELYLADDSGLCVKALNGAPGLKSARYAPSAPERIRKLLNAMKDIKDRDAEFKCAMVVADKSGKILFQTEESCKGRILDKETGNGGFGYDPIFFVNSENRGMAELTEQEKSKVSHRAKALRKVLFWLKNEYSQ